MRMRAAVLVKPRKFEIQEVEIPPLKPTQMLVRVKSCGICHSSMANYLGQGTNWMGTPLELPLPPGAPGHEPVGVVEEVGEEVKKFKIGDKVTGMGFTPGFAEYSVVDFAGTMWGGKLFTPMVVKVPDNIPVEYGIGEPIKCCATIARHSRVKFGDYVFVAGSGYMGLLIIAGLASKGLSELIACDLIDSRLKLAKELGATVTLNSKEVDVVKEVESITDGKMCDVAIEGIGHPAGVTLTSKVIKDSPPPGTIILYGYHAVPDNYDLSMWGPKAPLIISLHPAYSPDQMRDLEISMKAVEKGIYPVEKLITHKWKLEEINEAHEAAYKSPPLEGYIKGIVTA
jgi:threonine dehydrogenase-like Zn-dependent dehydrogenase